MDAAVPTYASCDGGLILNSNKFSLLDKPGVATKLRNFEVALKGGYRRINGYEKYGGVSATRPNGATEILGVHPYALGVVVCAGTGVYYSEDGITWTQVNKDTTEAGVVVGGLAALATLARPNQGIARFVSVKGTIDHATNPYGVLYIATGNDSLVHFHINGTGGSRTFHYVQATGMASADLIEGFDHHLCVVDSTNAPNLVYYSNLDDYDEFTGGTSGSIRVPEAIVAIKGFRDSLYVFCKNSIHRLVNINDPANLQILPVTANLGCVSSRSVQEVGGDIVFLSADGFRNVAGTARISDVELSSVSKSIQPLVNSLVDSLSAYTINSVVLREKSQYRLYYSDVNGVTNGYAGTLRQDEYGNSGFAWSELRGMNVRAISSGLNGDGEEIVYHGSSVGYVYLHDVGNSFDGGDIEAEYQSPDTHFGDLGLRKTLKYVNLSLTNEGAVSVSLTVNFDFGSTSVLQPQPFIVSVTNAPAVFGTATFGSVVFGQTAEPLEKLSLQGSGHSVGYKFYSNDSRPPYTINGFHTELMPSGRK